MKLLSGKMLLMMVVDHHLLCAETCCQTHKDGDFTINAFFWNLEGLIGRTQSFEDMKNKKIRFIGNAEDRLKDDNVRGWRFFRFLSKLKKYGFTAEDNSLRGIRKKWSEIYEKSNATRVLLELEKLM